MEVDHQSIDECKEGDGDAFLALHELGAAAAADSRLPNVDGPMPFSGSEHHLPPPRPTLIDAPVCALCRCVGAPLVSPCLAQPVDSAGKPRCALCPTRLTNCKGKLHKHGNGLICQRCYNNTRRPHHTPSESLTPPRSHKRKEPPTGQPPSTPTTILSPPSPPPTLPTILTHGTSLRSSTRTNRATAASWDHLARDSELDQWELKRGGFYQHDTAESLKCSFLDEKRVRLRHSAERIARAELTALGIDASPLRLAAIKLLRTSTGEGLQEIH